jgi:hypothetical protein
MIGGKYIKLEKIMPSEIWPNHKDTYYKFTYTHIYACTHTHTHTHTHTYIYVYMGGEPTIGCAVPGAGGTYVHMFL